VRVLRGINAAVSSKSYGQYLSLANAMNTLVADVVAPFENIFDGGVL